MTLPEEKKNKLIEKVANDTKEFFHRHIKDLESHEIPSGTAHEIVRKAGGRVVDKWEVGK